MKRLGIIMVAIVLVMGLSAAAMADDVFQMEEITINVTAQKHAVLTVGDTELNLNPDPEAFLAGEETQVIADTTISAYANFSAKLSFDSEGFYVTGPYIPHDDIITYQFGSLEFAAGEGNSILTVGALGQDDVDFKVIFDWDKLEDEGWDWYNVMANEYSDTITVTIEDY